MKDSNNPCLRCPHCAGPLSKEMETSSWTVPPLIRDGFSMIGSAVGGTASAFYGFNHAMPIVQRWVKGPMWLHFLIGMFWIVLSTDPESLIGGPIPGGAVPALAQLVSCGNHIFIIATGCFTR
ncbi:PREDICTED: uncharacterized protein LOC104611173 isoform X2 [Nelumbo nucifera]|uniref:Uncharacterized protein LOC104611173 isoform X2 n=1 Tax=Nelumbo nucifera TaxID=4432 RepID=A0A1U8B665_NELNU|nr:PREDICTED: uncharacterized protein LOC104611173 isoform X2 [Nelumbo nucifera]